MSTVRYWVIYGLLHLARSDIPRVVSLLQQIERQPLKAIEYKQNQRLLTIIQHAYQYVPYYRARLERVGLVNREGVVDLKRFSDLDVLTKNDLRSHFDDLRSRDPGVRRRKPYTNTSGGSTGEPVPFLQDKVYSDWNIANKIYYKTFAGQHISDRELRLWGSERDILAGRKTLADRLKQLLYNRKEINAFRMAEADFLRTLQIINEWRPTWIEAYVQSMHEMARFVEDQHTSVHSPRAILTSAGTLYPPIKEAIARVFDCPVLNRYGSREVGDMACSCPEDRGLHLASLHHYFEILDDERQPVSPGDIGRVYVTTLTNFSMPLLRYDIGDVAQRPLWGEEHCSCGRGFPLIRHVRGREVDLFRTRTGEKIDGEYFTHLFYLKPWCRMFQVIQKDYDTVIIRLVLNPSTTASFIRDQENVRAAIRKVMGEQCQINFELVDTIESLESGKYRYTISKVR